MCVALVYSAGAIVLSVLRSGGTSTSDRPVSRSVWSIVDAPVYAGLISVFAVVVVLLASWGAGVAASLAAPRALRTAYHAAWLHAMPALHVPWLLLGPASLLMPALLLGFGDRTPMAFGMLLGFGAITWGVLCLFGALAWFSVWRQRCCELGIAELVRMPSIALTHGVLASAAYVCTGLLGMGGGLFAATRLRVLVVGA